MGWEDAVASESFNMGVLLNFTNQEDHCTGRFWEGRFKSQPILDEAGLLACCVYVDLNPVRAGIAATPEASDFTAIQQRLQTFAAQRASADATPAKAQNVAPPLHPFANHLNTDPAQGMPYTLLDYVELVDWTARIVRADKKGVIASHTPLILQRLGFSAAEFHKHMQAQAMTRGTVIGQVERLKAYAIGLKKRCVRGVRMPAMWMTA